MRLVPGERFGAQRAANALNRFDIAIIQVDEGLHGGLDGEDILELLAGIAIPVIAVLHTVPTAPAPRWCFHAARLACCSMSTR